MKTLELPVKKRKILLEYNVGEEVNLNGILYTARDKVHSLADEKDEWPFKLKNNGIFYTGPTLPKDNFIFGSCGPTTSSRMDSYTPKIYSKGLAVTVGKGPRSLEVVKAVKKYGGLYLTAFGGCGALYGSRIVDACTVAYEDLGPQAVYKLTVEDLPVIVGIDSKGRSLFK